MNNPNPFVPKGSLQDQQNKRRTQMKLGVLCVLAVSVAGLMAMLIQGCKQKPQEDQNPPADTNSAPAPDTNTPPADLSNSNQPPAPGTNGSVMVPSPNTGTVPPASNAAFTPSPIVTPPTPIVQQPVVPPAATPDLSGGSEYTVAKGDILAKIARKNGVSLKELMAANPDVKPTRLKVGQKLVIPAGGKSLTDTSAGTDTGAAADTGGESYKVKSGDTLAKIARTHHVKLKALIAANGLTSTKIKVGKVLKIPSKGEAPVVPVETPVAPPQPQPDNSLPAPPVPSVSAPAPAVPAVPAQH